MDLDLSICIVTYNACDYLRECLRSLEETLGPLPGGDLSYEVIVVDNHSADGAAAMLRAEFPSVRLVENPRNLGYTVPMNQALRLGRGRYLVQLNPDTVAQPGAFQTMLAYMDAHPQVGICGPKVLNPDGTLQKPCRRGEPRPLAVAGYFFGLGRLFPQHQGLNEYLLTYLDENQTYPVAGVSGACMLIRRTLVEQIGYLDETIYAYQEDADYCRRARDAGSQVIYLHEARIMHYGGRGGSRVERWRSIYEWHRAYYIYYRKHLAKDYCFLFNWCYYGVIAAKLALALLQNLFRRQPYAGPKR